jgi:hypothetical protein
LSGDVRDDDSDDGGTEYMIIMWNRETMIWIVQKTLRYVTIAGLKWWLLTVVSIGKEKTERGKVKSSAHIWRIWQNIMTKLPGKIGRAKNTDEANFGT